MYLPYYLVHSILLLSVQGIADQETSVQDAEDVCLSDLSLWDVGFALQRGWAQQYDNATCPVPAGEETENEHEQQEGSDKDDFVSFEEWKRIRQAETPLPTLDVAEPSSSAVVHEQPEEIKLPLPRSDNRYNYASPDCSARIIKSSSQTQHASSILHKSKDRYMLTPCKAGEHWVIVELCDEIRIESFEIAVWEFFSGIVRDIKISAEDDEGWKEVASFVGRNVRGVQTFHLDEPTSFYRFIRLDFSSHYGSEYYCPVSQLKVFGMNQMEAFKWEQKHAPVKPIIVADDEPRIKEEQERAQMNRQRRKGEAEREKELGELEKLVHREANRERVNSTIVKSTTTMSTAKPSSTANETALDRGNTTAETSIKRDQSESIYAAINRRLNNLEGNSSLVARYIEEQSRVMRSALAALERDWDEWRMERDTAARVTWDQERMRQEDRLGRIMSMMESQRMVWDRDRQAFDAQLRILTEELSYERRRGYAQLVVLVVVIGLGIATRSSVIDAVLKPLMQPSTRMDTRVDLRDQRPRHRGTPRRPSTPLRRTAGQTMRSFSIMDPRNTIPGRKLAKSAHLHTFKAKDPEVTDVEDHLV